MDDFYNEIIKYDLGDTWIHGVATYPKEVGELRRAREIVKNSVLSPDDERVFYENSILFSEHTWGMDIKTHLTWQRSYDNVLYSTAQKGYVKDSTQKTTEISAKISDSELGAIIKNVFHREN